MQPSLARVAIVSLGLLACGSKADRSSSSKERATVAPFAGLVGPGRIAVPGLGISVDVPRPVQFRESTAHGALGASMTLGDFSIDFVTGDAVNGSVEAAKTRLGHARSPMTQVTKEKLTEGGWHLEYVAEGSVDKNKLRGVDIRVTLAGIPYECSAISRSADEAKMYAAVCDSIQRP